MSQETLVYIVNLLIGVILAGLMTRLWFVGRRDRALGYWMVAAWVMAVADAFFAARPWLPFAVGRFVPTLMVTVGQGVLLSGALQFTGRSQRIREIGGVVLVHALLLTTFLAVDPTSSWRTVSNGMIWSVLAVACYVALRRAAEPARSALLPAAVAFLAHGVFHAWRITYTAIDALAPGAAGGSPIQLVADVEVSFFMVALFVSLIIAHLQLRNEELRVAMRDVRELSGLLPICAWCRKIRSDDGYWEQLEQYLAQRHIQVTHGMCESCAEKHIGSLPESSGA